MIPITITAAADGLSNAVDLEEEMLVGFIVSASWTAAAISFLAAPTSAGTYGSCYDDANAEITVASAGVVAGRTVLFSSAVTEKLRGVQYLKLRSGITGAAVQQAATRTFTLITRQF